MLVFAWKIALFIFTAQPIPANDAFFYDGAVIHHLLHGGYYNPSVAQAFPVSGREVFSAYPPLYQVPLLAWMSVFGASALSAMALHLCLFGFYMFALFAILQRLQIPAWCVNAAGVFLLGFTFHDRPDSLAHLLGMLAIYACVRSRKLLGRGAASGAVWVWLMALFIVLAFCTSLQIGGIYFLVVSFATLTACQMDKEPAPFLPMSLMVVVPVALVLIVKLALPRAWAGFMENVHQTPFITGLRVAHWQEGAKIVRTVPGILVVAVLLPISWFKQHHDFESDTGRRYEIILLAAFLPALGIVAASLTLLSPNTVAIANYLQPVIVACYLGACASLFAGQPWLRAQIICLVPAMLLVSVRAVGMTTWGVACAADVGYAAAVQRVETELAGEPPGYKVVMSSAFLYGAAKHGKLTLIHSDWMTPANGDSRVSDTEALLHLEPQKMILTQYDYYRRFEAVLDRVKTDPSLAAIQVANTARTKPPDAIQSLRQVVQHVSWAPVIVNLSWRGQP